MGWGDGAIDPIILNLSTNCGVSLTHRPIYSGNKPPLSNAYKAWWGPVPVWKRKVSCFCWDSSSDYQACSLTTIPNAICRVQRIFIALWSPHDIPMQAQWGGGVMAPTKQQPQWVVGGQHRALAALVRGGIRYLCREAGLPSRTSAWARKNSPPPEFDQGAVRPVESRYADWYMPAACFETRQTDFPVGIKLMSFKVTCVHWKTDVPL